MPALGGHHELQACFRHQLGPAMAQLGFVARSCASWSFHLPSTCVCFSRTHFIEALASYGVGSCGWVRGVASTKCLSTCSALDPVLLDEHVVWLYMLLLSLFDFIIPSLCISLTDSSPLSLFSRESVFALPVAGQGCSGADARTIRVEHAYRERDDALGSCDGARQASAWVYAHPPQRFG